jgi:hypothetical protein
VKLDESDKLAYDPDWPVLSDTDVNDSLNKSEDATKEPAHVKDTSLKNSHLYSQGNG